MLIYSATQIYVIEYEEAKKLIIHAAGLTATTGWTRPRLTRVEVSVPERPLDPTILQFNFEADRPEGPNLQVLTPIQASLEIRPEDSVNGVTVHAQTNSVSVHVSSFADPAAHRIYARGQAPATQMMGQQYATVPSPQGEGGPPTDPNLPGEVIPHATYINLMGQSRTTYRVGEKHVVTAAVGEEVTTLGFGEGGPGPFGCL